MTSVNDWFQEGLEHHQAGRLSEAAGLYQKVLGDNPVHTDSLYLLGVIAHQTGNFTTALTLNCRVLDITPGDARCYNVAGLALMGLDRDAEAEASFEQAIAIENNPEYHNNLGTLWKKQGRLDEAVAAFGRALAERPQYANAHYNLGNAHRERGDLVLSAASFERAANIDPAHARALVALGQVLQALHRPEEALPYFERALALIPDDADLYCDAGDALQALGRLADAIHQYRRALDSNPRSSRAWYAAGCAEGTRSDHAAASACFRRALEIDPERREARHNLGHSLFKLGQVEAAMGLFRKAATLGDPEQAEGAIAVIIPGDPGSGNPEILESRRTWLRRQDFPPPSTVRCRPTPQEGPLRIGYISAFFQDHNWMKPVWGLINQHHREAFAVHLFSDAPASKILHGYRPHPHDQFHDITGLSNAQAAELVENAGVDILVDLNGYSATDRLPLMALHPAPVLLGWFNIYATTGMSCYDCLVGDAVVVPPEEERWYSEKIERVPGSYLTFEVDYPVPEVASLPCDHARAITFGCLAPQYKITPAVIDAWSAILQQVPGSRLILKNSALGSPGNRQFVQQLFEARGIPAERLGLEGPAGHYQFLEAYSRIDLALDTFPYNGGTTTTEAIWQGVPVITFWGDRWVSRTSASILCAGTLGEFVAPGKEGYVALAVETALAAGATDRLRSLRRDMRSRLRASPVCDTRGFARNMERLYLRTAAHARAEG